MLAALLILVGGLFLMVSLAEWKAHWQLERVKKEKAQKRKNFRVIK